ncbi:MAG: hypothetical protein HDR14_05735 [Lachnospiraceae bacterium]|nr:hypothetical protein [Lachnospiraceae bacterium]
MYQFTTTERNNAKASEYETKSMLYLFGCRHDSKDMDVFIIDCFNDVSGADCDVQRLWDVQSKGVKSLDPRKIGIALITLFQNYISDIEFEHYILFIPRLKEMYLKDENKKYFQIDNFKLQYVDKVKKGLRDEYERRNHIAPIDTELENFLQEVEFVIAEEDNQEYIKRITSFRSSLRLEKAFYDAIFDDIRNQQTILKTKNINGYQIMNAVDVLEYEKVLWKKDIDALVINRILGMNIFNSRHVPNSFIDEIALLDFEERKDVIQECQSDIARLLFDKNGRHIFWRFFGKMLTYDSAIKLEKPREIAEKMKRDNVIIPRTLNEMSVVYLISALKEGLTDGN